MFSRVVISYICIVTLPLFSVTACQKTTQSTPGSPVHTTVFVRQVNHINHLYLMDLDSNGIGANVRRLTQDNEAENYPNWSPDGKQLVYQRDFNGSAIYTIDSDGKNQKRISPSPAFDVTPDWSPDGKQIIFSRLDGPMTPGQRPQTEINIINADGTGVNTILSKSDFSVEPHWSVNDFVVFMSYRLASQSCSSVGCAPRWQSK